MIPIEIAAREITDAGLTMSDVRPVVFGAGQPEYIPLPAVVINGEYGQMVVKWRLTWRERLRLAITGTLFHSQLTFGQSLQPINITTDMRNLIEQPTIN